MLICVKSTFLILSIICLFSFSDQSHDVIKFEKLLLDSDISDANNYVQFLRYSNVSTFNGTLYYPAASLCELHKEDKYFRMCINLLGSQTLEKNSEPYWQQADRSESSCSYSMNLHHVVYVHSVSLPRFYFFRLKADCPFQEGKLRGGSSIEVFSNSTYLQRCRVYDYSNDVYDILCSPHYPLFPLSHDLSTGVASGGGGDTTECVFLTVTVNYEHYDSYSETFALPNNFLPMQTAPLLARTYCPRDSLGARVEVGEVVVPATAGTPFPSTPLASLVDSSPLTRAAATALTLAAPASYSAGLLDPGRAPSSDLLSHPDVHYQKVIAVTPTPPSSSSSSSLRVLSGVWRKATDDGSETVYAPSPGAPASYAARRASINTRPEYKFEWMTRLGGASSSSSSAPRVLLDHYDDPHACFDRADVHLVGESHIRYDYLHLFYELANANETVTIVGDANLTSRHFHRRSLFYQHMAEVLEEECTRVLQAEAERVSTSPASPPPAPPVYVIQTGSWDVAYFPLEQPANNCKSGARFLQAVRNIKERGCEELMKV